jgi:hypothetical protein
MARVCQRFVVSGFQIKSLRVVKLKSFTSECARLTVAFLHVSQLLFAST